MNDLHKCPNCGHKYPNYHYYGYLEDFYICPKCNHKERVKDNYEIISSYVKQMQMEFFQMIEKQLEYLINAPSTINSIIKYYKIATDEQGNYYLIFNKDKIIRRYSNPKDHYYQKLRLETWIQMGLTIKEPGIIMPPK